MNFPESLLEPNIERLLGAFHLEEPDRVPNFDPQIMHRTMQFILGKPMPKGDNWGAPIEDYIELCKRTGSDAMVYGASLWPLGHWSKGIREKHEELKKLAKKEDFYDYFVTHAFSLEGWTSPKDWKDPHKLESLRANTPSIIENRVKFFQSVFKKVEGTKIGVAPLILCDVVFFCYGLFGLANFSKMLYADRDLIERIMDIYTEETVKLATALAELNFSFIFLNSDPCDSHGTIIPPRLMADLWMPHIEAMIKPFKRKSIPMIMHSCGNLTQLIPLLVDLGIKAVHPVQPGCNDIYALKKKHGDEICLIGNIDMAGALSFGTPQEVVKEVKEHIDRLAGGGGYVCATSHSVTEDIIPENYMAMLKTIHKYGVYL